ncbi:MAG: polyphosphate polymerase domain-containing protein [Armatimonas sp.]
MDGEFVRAGMERKFLVPEEDAQALLSAVRAQLAPDPFAGATGEYEVHSLYLDTPDLACWRRELTGKWRLRRYGSGNMVFAEYKARPEPGRVHKRRTALPVADCALLPMSRAGWFSQAIRKQSLAPVCNISYHRYAFVGEGIRLTLDNEIRAARCETYIVPGEQPHTTLLTTSRVLEVKFEEELSPALEALLSRFGLLPESFSKYRTAIERLNLSLTTF